MMRSSDCYGNQGSSRTGTHGNVVPVLFLYNGNVVPVVLFCIFQLLTVIFSIEVLQFIYKSDSVGSCVQHVNNNAHSISCMCVRLLTLI